MGAEKAEKSMKVRNKQKANILQKRCFSILEIVVIIFPV